MNVQPIGRLKIYQYWISRSAQCLSVGMTSKLSKRLELVLISDCSIYINIVDGQLNKERNLIVQFASLQVHSQNIAILFN